MALAHRYVAIYPSGTTDPDGTASQGDPGENYSASYTSMSSMEAAENGDFSGGDGTVLHVEIIPSDGAWNSADTTGVEFDGWKTDRGGDGSYVHIKAYGTARTNGVRSTSDSPACSRYRTGVSVSLSVVRRRSPCTGPRRAPSRVSLRQRRSESSSWHT